MKNIIKQLLRETFLAEEAYTNNIREFLDQDPKLMTMGTAYYTADMNSSMNKSYVDENGIKQPNPMYNKIYKHTRFIFRWKDTYARAVERTNPQHEFGKRRGEYEKIEGYTMLESGKSGEYLPIIPTGSEAVYTIYENGNWKPVDYLSIKKYLKEPSPSTFNPPSGVRPRQLILDKTFMITGAGNTWKNPSFPYKYLGPEKKTN